MLVVAQVWSWAYDLGLPVLCVLGLLVLAGLAVGLARLPHERGRHAAIAVLTATCALVLAVTLRPYPGAHHVTYQPVPFLPLLQAVTGHGSTFVNDRLQLAGNMLMFAPLGLVLTHLQRVRRTRRVLVWALAGSVTIELLQAVTRNGRSVDVNDVLLNVAGAALGVAVHDLVRRRTGGSCAVQSSSWATR